MLKKLIHYDFVWIEKVLLYHTAVLLVVSALGRLIHPLNARSAFWLVMDRTFLSLFFAASFSLLFTAFLRTCARYVNTLYKDESYLTHTLPVPRGTLYTAKALAGLWILLLSLLVCLGATAIYNSYADRFSMVKTLLSDAQMRPPVLLLALLLVLELCCLLLCTLLGLTLGYRRQSHKLLHSLLLTCGVYLLTCGTLIGVFALCGLFDNRILDLFGNQFTALQDFAQDSFGARVCAILAVEYLAANTVLFLCGRHALQKGVNVD